MDKNKDRYYVYIHKDHKGNVFYVGKGTRDRAWAKNNERQVLWQRYVEKLNGEYHVEIYKGGLSENEALSIESGLMEKYGGSLINWINFSRSIDSDRYKKYWEYREKNDILLKKARSNEKTDLEKAVYLYKQALEELIEKDSLSEGNEHYTGLALEVYQEFEKNTRTGNIIILDRLTICLKKLGKIEEIVLHINNYLDVFPAAKKMASFNKILKRGKML